MNENPGRHLTEEQLLGFLDHELPRREFGAAREHLGTCWKCQTEMNELRETIAEFVRYQQKASQVESAVDPAGWPDLRHRMREFERAEGEARRVPGPGLRWSWFTRSMLALAAIASLTFAALLVSRRDSPAPVPSSSVPSRTDAAAPATAFSAPASSIPLPSTTAAIPPLAVASAGGLRPEVGALVTLHELDADLGEPVRVESRPGGKVAVTGSGLSAERETEIAAALRSRPEIAVQFEQPSNAPAVAAPARVRSVSQSSASLNAALSPVLGGPREVESFANAVLDESDELMSRAYALNNIAQHFPASARAGLNGDERVALARIEADHRGKLTEHARRIEQLLTTLEKAGAEAPSAVAAAGLFDSARRLDRAVNRAFGAEVAGTPMTHLFSELLTASKQLDAALGAR